jgi:prepilin-type N-terminal cleavage/methylation domain-containing protein
MNNELRTNKGFSLAEAVMAVVVLGIAAAGILLPFTSGAAVQAEGVHRTLAAKLAADLMEEIVNTPVEMVMGRHDDYYTELKGCIKDSGGTVFSGSDYACFSRAVTCAHRTISGASFILVTVRVCYNDREMASISRLISEQ